MSLRSTPAGSGLELFSAGARLNVIKPFTRVDSVSHIWCDICKADRHASFLYCLICSTSEVYLGLTPPAYDCDEEDGDGEDCFPLTFRLKTYAFHLPCPFVPRSCCIWRWTCGPSLVDVRIAVAVDLPSDSCVLLILSTLLLFGSNSSSRCFAFKCASIAALAITTPSNVASTEAVAATTTVNPGCGVFWCDVWSGARRHHGARAL
ncbi:hypothetical protein HaLaN_11135 [Haematococcus lacustris]|uniref:Uncharacterized protein n=1 Tax=Haematococcus lacustris TaxID=44745 RepID=A0A699Z754_HAELA|nr:hypothetical protein HaLaN_11135 [Haematococcus lacustris]